MAEGRADGGRETRRERGRHGLLQRGRDGHAGAARVEREHITVFPRWARVQGQKRWHGRAGGRTVASGGTPIGLRGAWRDEGVHQERAGHRGHGRNAVYVFASFSQVRIKILEFPPCRRRCNKNEKPRLLSRRQTKHWQRPRDGAPRTSLSCDTRAAPDRHARGRCGEAEDTGRLACEAEARTSRTPGAVLARLSAAPSSSSRRRWLIEC